MVVATRLGLWSLATVPNQAGQDPLERVEAVAMTMMAMTSANNPRHSWAGVWWIPTESLCLTTTWGINWYGTVLLPAHGIRTRL